MTCYSFPKMLLFFLYIFIQIIYCHSQEKRSSIYLSEKCMNYSCCDEVKKLRTFVCKNVNNSESVPSYFRDFNAFPFAINATIFKLEFTGMKNLPARAFDGHFMYFLHIDDPDVTVDENVLEEAIFICVFSASQSSIKVRYVIIKKLLKFAFPKLLLKKAHGSKAKLFIKDL